MIDQSNAETGGAIFFLRSPVFVSIVVALISHAAALFGKHVSATVITDIVQNVLEGTALAASAYAAYKRWRSTIAPLTIKKDTTK